MVEITLQVRLWVGACLELAPIANQGFINHTMLLSRARRRLFDLFNPAISWSRLRQMRQKKT